MVRRILVYFILLLTTLLSLIFAVSTIRSFDSPKSVGLSLFRREVFLLSNQRHFRIEYQHILDLRESPNFSFYIGSADVFYNSRPDAFPDRIPGEREYFRWHGFSLVTGVRWQTYHVVFYSYGIYLIILFMLPIAICIVRKKWVRKRVVSGHCAKCGYDLSASPERCPECGTMVKK